MPGPASSHAVRGTLTITVLAVLATLLLLPGFWWGSPHATAADRTQSWGVDDETPLGALGQVYNIVDPQPLRNTGYLRMHSFMVTAVYAPHLAFTWLTGGIDQVSAEYPFGLVHPERSIRTLALIGHLLSVCLGVGIVLIAFRIGELMWDRTTGAWSALFTLSTYPIYYYSRTGNVDVPMLFFLAAATWAFARCLSTGFSMRHAVWLGICAGFALATKESALGALIVMPLMLLVVVSPGPFGPESRQFWRAAGAGIGASGIAFGLGSGLLFDPAWFVSHLRQASATLDKIASGDVPTSDAYTYGIADSIALLIKQWHLLVDASTLPGIILVAVGLAWIARREPRKLALFWMALSYFVFMYLLVRSGQLRYLLPMAFLLTFYAGRTVTLACSTKVRTLRVAVFVLAVAAIGQGLVHGVTLTYEMINDSRYAATAWLAERTRPGDHIEYFGPPQKLPHLKAGVITQPATFYDGMYMVADVSADKVQQIRSEWEERRPKFVLVMPDHTSAPGQPHSHTLPPPLFDELVAGTGAYHQVAVFHTEPPLSWLRRPALDYPTVNPPIRVFARIDDNRTRAGASSPALR